MKKRWDVEATIVSQKKKCVNGHKVGDKWIFGSKSPGGLCMGAFASLLPYVTTLRFGGSFPWMKEDGEGEFSCPDAEVCNVFRLRRLKGK